MGHPITPGSCGQISSRQTTGKGAPLPQARARPGRRPSKDDKLKASARLLRWQGIWRECSITRRPRQAICVLHSSLFGNPIQQPQPAALAGDKDTIRFREWQAKIISATNDLRSVLGRFSVGDALGTRKIGQYPQFFVSTPSSCHSFPHATHVH